MTTMMESTLAASLPFPPQCANSAVGALSTMDATVSEPLPASPAPPQLWSLPPQDKDDHGRLTVVLDIDETLIHTTRNQNGSYEDLDSFKIKVFDEVFTVLKRPSLDAFLKKASSQYELISFTAGVEEYSKAVLKAIDPEGKYFRHNLFRQHCAQLNTNTIVKDLRIINRCPSRVVLVDNTLSNFFLQPENGVPITTFVNDAADTALNVLLEFLAYIDPVKDVRVALRATFHLHELFKLKFENA